MKKAFFVIILLSMLVVVTGCHTVSGMGDDLSYVGHKIGSIF
jgi:predicted small secreted protein